MPHEPFTHLGLTFRVDHYYLKRPRIVQKIVFENRTFYAKFERIDEPPNALVSRQHLNGEYTVALPLTSQGTIDYLVFEYKGEAAFRFAAFMRHFLPQRGYKTLHIFQRKQKNKVQIFIEIDPVDLDTAHRRLQALGKEIDTLFGKGWKALPSAELPEDYNIVTLPYERC